MVKTMQNSKTTYRKGDCLKMCYSSTVGKKCGCTTTNNIYGLPPCLTDAQMSNYLRQYFEIPKTGIVKECDKLCPQECSTAFVSGSTSFTTFPSSRYLDKMSSIYSKLGPLLDNNWSLSNVRDKVLEVNAYFGSLESTNIEEIDDVDSNHVAHIMKSLFFLFLLMSLLVMTNIFASFGFLAKQNVDVSILKQETKQIDSYPSQEDTERAIVSETALFSYRAEASNSENSGLVKRSTTIDSLQEVVSDGQNSRSRPFYQSPCLSVN